MQGQGLRRPSRRKIMAVAAGAVVLGVGVTATLAAWTDTEWVFGGDGTGGPGIGTSSFAVQESTVAPYTTFTSERDNPGGEAVFAPDALNLSPGDSTYALVALRTAPTSVAGDLTLQPAVAAAGIVTNDPGDLLMDALTVRVATSDTLGACDASAFGLGADIIADGPLTTTGGSSAQTVDAAAGSVQYYCFEVTLPAGFTPAPGTTADDYMGRTVAPAWEFTAES
jgi:predicted ribosomally synthesized peptide with SipW-like signal peptide